MVYDEVSELRAFRKDLLQEGSELGDVPLLAAEFVHQLLLGLFPNS